MKCLTLSAFILFGCVQLFGQESRKEITVGFRVSHSVLDASFGDNAQRLAEITSFLNEVKGDSTLDLVEVAFCGSASPEGSIALNRRLAAKRRAALEDYVRRRVELPDSLVRRIDNVIAWERLTRLVEQSDMAGREEVLDVLRNEPEFTFDRRGALVDSRKKHLMDLHGGRSWHYMLRHFYPELRNASAVIITVREVVSPVEPEPVAEVDIVTPPPPAPVDTVVPAPVVEPEPKKPFYMAVKTNMLYDLLAVPNLGVEFYLGKGWSVSGNWIYGWWSPIRATASGASTAVSSPCASGSAVRPTPNPSRATTSVFTVRSSPTTSSGVAKATSAVNPAKLFGTRPTTLPAWSTATPSPSPVGSTSTSPSAWATGAANTTNIFPATAITYGRPPATVIGSVPPRPRSRLCG